MKLSAATVRLSSKYQVVIPRAAREALQLAAGDELLVLVKEDRLVMIPKPENFANRMSRLHAGIWKSASAHLDDERAW